MKAPVLCLMTDDVRKSLSKVLKLYLGMFPKLKNPSNFLKVNEHKILADQRLVQVAVFRD